MATAAFGNSDFLVGYCLACDKNVLTHLDLTPDDGEIRRCLHCDEIIPGPFKSVSSDQLEANGYAIVEARTCGNGGGCGVGGCGMRQRAD